MANPTVAVPRFIVPFNEEVIEWGLQATVQTLYPNEMIGLDTNCFATKCDDTAALKFLGLNAESVRIEVKSGDAAGAKRVKVIRPRYFAMLIESASLTDGTVVGRTVYAKFSNEVSFSPGSFGNAVGTVVQQLSATEVLIEPLKFAGDGTDGDAYHEVFSDFDYYVTGDLFTSILTDSGTAAVGDAVNGVITITASDGSIADNDEAYIKGTHETFLFAANKPISISARIKLTETLADEANIIVGLIEAAGANSLGDNGGGPPTSNTVSALLFYKREGSNDWRGQLGVNGSGATVLDLGALTSGEWTDLRITWTPVSATHGRAKFLVNGIDPGGQITLPFAGATEMQVILGTKNGNGTNNMSLLVDRFRAKQLR